MLVKVRAAGLNRADLMHNVASMTVPGKGERRLFSIIDPSKLRLILKRMLDEDEFLSDYGIRSLSRAHRDQPYVLVANGSEHRVDYEPGESRTDLFGGNSNWRGPVWFPLNYLLIESLQKYGLIRGFAKGLRRVSHCHPWHPGGYDPP